MGIPRCRGVDFIGVASGATVRTDFSRKFSRSGRSGLQSDLQRSATSRHCERSEAISQHGVSIERLLRRFAPRNDSSGSVFAAHPEHLSVRFA
jgi:gamma-glutamyl-gamma-aminobutyrate hydrolase PuuD